MSIRWIWISKRTQFKQSTNTLNILFYDYTKRSFQRSNILSISVEFIWYI